MARARTGRPTAPSPAEMHRSWLELVDVEGPFLAIPPLKRVWPNGIPGFRSIHPDRYTTLADARKEFEAAWDQADKHPDDEKTQASYREARDQWVQTVLRDVIGWQDSLVWGDATGIQAQSPSLTVTISPQGVLTDPDGAHAALVYVIDPVDSLRETPNDGWAATPIDRLEELLRASDIPIGIITDGRWWGLVSARTGSMPASGVVDSLTWIEEPRTRDAFLTILGRQYLIGGAPDERLPVLFEESIAAAEEITEALGVQVRRAVELLVQAFSESASEASRRDLPDPLPERSHDVYEAAVTVMMRAVFLLFAEERGLLPTGELFEQGYGLSGELDRLARREAEDGEESLDSTSLTWHRLLATSAAIYGGATFENLRMPAYGGSLFDPARFPCLTATTDEGTLAITVSDRVMLHVLRSVQLAVLKGGEARQISFRDIDVEQIGYIYEGLLGYTTTRVDEAYVGLKGIAGAEPEIPLATLEELRHANADAKPFAAALREWVAADQPAAKAQSAAAIARGLSAEIDPGAVSALSQAVGGDADLIDRIKPFLGIIRHDLRSRPYVVDSGGLLVKETPSRKNAGAHYTPKSLAEEVVLHALQPLCYSPGPHETGNEAEWRLRPSEEILDLKVADIACGSGAFLVASARYLADRVVEAWIAEDPDKARRKDLHIRAIRQVVANCLYGADINDMAVEMAKLSLWLVSLDRDLPFSFVDDKIFLGNSLLGLTSLDQLRKLHIDPANASGQDVLNDVDVDIDAVIRKAIELRERLASEIDEGDLMRSITAKRRQYEQLQAVTAELLMLADGVIAAGLPLGGKPGRALDETYQNLRLAVKQAQPVGVGGAGDASWLELIIDEGLTPTVDTDYERWKPLHWVLEAPDVLVDHGGFDAVVGNPPFLGVKSIRGAIGQEMRDFLANRGREGESGRSDLVVFFLRRAAHLSRKTVGLLVTDAIESGDTSRYGLAALLSQSWVLYRARTSTPWPTASAGVRISYLWLSISPVESPAVLDHVTVRCIGASLTDAGDADNVQFDERLVHELHQVVPLPHGYQATIILGKALVVEPDEIEGVRKAGGGAYLRPYMSGEDLAGTVGPHASRYCLDVSALSEGELRSMPRLHSWLVENVYPERARQFAKYPKLKAKWWGFLSPVEELYAALENVTFAVAFAKHSKHLWPTCVAPNQVFSNGIIVYPTDSDADYGFLASEFHRLWAIHAGGSKLNSSHRYNPSRLRKAYPFPARLGALSRAGHSLRIAVEAGCAHAQVGTTQLLNLVNDPKARGTEIRAIRSCVIELNVAVAELHGYSGPLEVDFQEDETGATRFGLSPAAERSVLAHLLDQNQAAAETRLSRGSQPTDEMRSDDAVKEGTLFS
mgnify:CR=1 FL=1